MAIFFLRVQTIRRAAGRSIVAVAAYRAGERLPDQRTGQTFDYRRRSGVAATGMVGWDGARAALWNAAEAAEKRRDAVVGREVLVALPAGLPQTEQEVLLGRLARWLRHRHGVAVDWCMHTPGSEGDERNWHGHILITARQVDAAGGFGAKTIELDRLPAGRQSIEAMRQAWAEMVNQALARQGVVVRVDSRSHFRQAASKGTKPAQPMLTLGPAASRSARNGQATWAAMENARRRAANGLLQALSIAIDAATETRSEQRQRAR